MFYITIGDGIGGAIILGGKLWIGASGFAGEVGHITIDREGTSASVETPAAWKRLPPPQTSCAVRNERLHRDSTSSLSKLAINKNFTADDVAHEARNGDDFSLMMIERTGKFIGQGWRA